MSSDDSQPPRASNRNNHNRAMKSLKNKVNHQAAIIEALTFHIVENKNDAMKFWSSCYNLRTAELDSNKTCSKYFSNENFVNFLREMPLPPIKDWTVAYDQKNKYLTMSVTADKVTYEFVLQMKPRKRKAVEASDQEELEDAFKTMLNDKNAFKQAINDGLERRSPYEHFKDKQKFDEGKLTKVKLEFNHDDTSENIVFGIYRFHFSCDVPTPAPQPQPPKGQAAQPNNASLFSRRVRYR
jgi:hypothetical protein